MKIWKWHFVHQHFKQNFCERLCRWVSAASYSFYGTHDRHTKHQNVDYNCFHELGKRYSWIGLQGSVGKKKSHAQKFVSFSVIELVKNNIAFSWYFVTKDVLSSIGHKNLFTISCNHIPTFIMQNACHWRQFNRICDGSLLGTLWQQQQIKLPEHEEMGSR